MQQQPTTPPSRMNPSSQDIADVLRTNVASPPSQKLATTTVSTPSNAMSSSSKDIAKLMKSSEPRYASQLLTTLKSFWLKKKLCDMTLKARRTPPSRSAFTLEEVANGDGLAQAHSPMQEDDTDQDTWESFQVHSIVAAAACPTIERRILSHRSGEPLEVVFSTCQVCAESLSTLLLYMYCGSVDLGTMDEILATLVASNYLGMNAATRACARLLIKFMNNVNVLLFLRLARRFQLDDLENVSFRCILEHFDEISATEEWLNVEPPTVAKILANHDLQCQGEGEMFLQVVRWVLHDPASRVASFEELTANTNLIRMCHIKEDVLRQLPESVRALRAKAPIAPTESAAVAKLDALVAKVDALVREEQQLRSTGKRAKRAPSRRYGYLKSLPNGCSYSFEGDGAHNGYVYSLVECDGYIVSGSRDHTIKIWSLYSKQCVASIPVDNRVWTLLAVKEGQCPGLGNRIVSGSWDNVIRVWTKYPNFESVREFRGHTNWVLQLVICANTLVSSSADNTIKVWDAVAGKAKHTLSGHRNHVYSLATLKPTDGEEYLISGSADKTIRVWNSKTWKCERLLEGHTNTVRTLCCVDGHLWSGSADNTIRVWDTTTWKCIKVISQHTDWVESLVEYDANHVISASRDETIRFWDKGSFMCKQTLHGHKNWVYALSVKDEKTVISGSADSSIKVWDYVAKQA